MNPPKFEAIETHRRRVGRLAAVLALLGTLSPGARAATMTPIPVSGFNRDVVLEKTAPTNTPYSTSLVRNLHASENTAFYQSGFTNKSYGLPGTGLFTNANDGTVFQFQPYTASNALVLNPDTGLTTATLSAAAPAIYNRIAVLAHSGYAGAADTANVTVHFVGGSSLAFPYYAPDWFWQSNGVLYSIALQGVERVGLANGATDGTPTNPRFYQTTIDLAAVLGATNKPVASLTFDKPATAWSTVIYAVSGEPSPQSPAAIVVQPAGATVNEFSPVTFSADVGGNPYPTAQWLRNGSPISGGTNLTYTIVAATPSDNGAVFRLVASNMVNSVSQVATSSPATLTVIPDTTVPTLVQLIPPAGSTVPTLKEIEVHFNEAVTGVDASDLRINGVPATNVLAYAPDVYVFQFPQPSNGPVQVTWSLTHNIRDVAANTNLFGGGTYNYTLDPAAITGVLSITEFMAGNNKTIQDEDGDYSDWVEVFNAGDQAVNLGGWYLTDNSSLLTKWRFPAGATLAPRSYMLVWASGNNRTNPAAPLHTNFKLNKSAGSFLGLVYLDGTNLVSSFWLYPQQYDDVSFGRDRLVPSFVGYFTNATPGAANNFLGAGSAGGVRFSRAGGTFQQPFSLALSADNSNSVIRYLLVTNAASAALSNAPNGSSPIYSGPLSISDSVQVRARAFPAQPNLFPGAPASETYVKITAGAAAFSSDLPIVLFHNFGGGTPPATVNQAAVMMVFGTVFGRASMTNPPDVVARIGLNIRGRTTLNFSKSSFSVETWDEFGEDHNVAVLGLPGESDWVFYAPNLYDKPLIHNPLMHELSRGVGRYSPRTRMVEVFASFNTNLVDYSSPAVGPYNGVYVLLEKIKAASDRVDIPRLLPGETNTAVITGGYILKNDSADSNERYVYAGNQWAVYVEPQMRDFAAYAGRAAQEGYISNYFRSFYLALTGANWTNPATGYAAWMDVPSWIDHHILYVLSRSPDALRLSGYFFKDRDKKIEMGPLWDFDRALDTGGTVDNEWRTWNPRRWTGSNPLGQSNGTDFGTDYFNASGVFANPWYGRLFTDLDFWQKWIDRYQELRQGALSTNSIFSTVDLYASQLAEAQPRQATRWAGSSSSSTVPRAGMVTVPAAWPDRSYSNNFSGTYAGEIAFLKRWLGDRLDFMDTNFMVKPVFNGSGGAITSGYPLTITAPGAEPGTSILYTTNGTDPRLPGGAIAPSAITATPPVNLVLSNNARVFARSRLASHQNQTGAGRPPLTSPWSGATAATFFITTPPLVITEIMYHPAPPASGTNTAEDFEFIELKNVGAQSLILAGFHFTNGVEFTFPTNNAVTNLGPGQYVVLVKNLAAFQSRYPGVTNVAGQYTNSLDNGGERLGFNGPLEEPILDFEYADAWYPVTDGNGFSLVIRNENAAFNTWINSVSWRASTQSGGSPGRADPAPTDIPAVLVNEALTHTDLPQVDAIELFNPTAAPVNLGGWFLSDDADQPSKYRIPTNTVVATGGFIVFNENQFNTGGSNAFALSSLGDQVYLSSGDGTNLTGYRHGFRFGAQANGVTFGRYATSDGREHFVTQAGNTLGAANAGPKVGPVVINEIMYAPFSTDTAPNTLEEFLELRNITGQSVPLFDPAHPTNTWRLDGGVEFSFPPGVTLAPWSHLLVVNFQPDFDPVMLAWFRSRYSVSTNTPVHGPYQGNLANEGERVGLYRPDLPQLPPAPDAGFVPYLLVEEVNYSDQPPWPAGATGTGFSLQRIAAIAFGDEPINWLAAAPTPDGLNVGAATADTDHDGLPDEWELANGLDPKNSNGSNGALGDPDGDGANNRQEYIAGTDPNNSGDCLRFDSVSVSNHVCVLSFNARPGRTYAIERIANLQPANNWSNLVSDIAGTGGIVTVQDPVAQVVRFYRLKVTLNP